MMATFDMLKRANAAGSEHGDLARGHLLERSRRYEGPDGNPLYKTQDRIHSEEQHGDLARSRSHARDEARISPCRRRCASVGVKAGEDAVMRPRIYTIPETTLGELAAQVKRPTAIARASLRRRSKAKVSKSSSARLCNAAHDCRKPTSSSAANSRKPTAASTTSNTSWTPPRSAWRKASSCWAT